MDDRNIGADKIIRQIKTENGRTDEAKMKLIMHIIDSVYGYCEEYGTNSKDALKELCKIKDSLKGDVLITKETAEKLDSYILRIFNLS